MIRNDDSNEALFKMEADGKQSLTVENIKYVKNFLKLGLYQVQLTDEVENERIMCISLLDEAVEYLVDREQGSRGRIIDTRAIEPPNMDSLTIAQEDLELYVNVSCGPRNESDHTTGPYCTVKVEDEHEDIYVTMDKKGPLRKGISNEDSEKGNDNTEKHPDHYANASMLNNQVSSGSFTEDCSLDDIVQPPQEAVKLFSATANIEEKWKKLNSNSVECVGPEFQLEAIRTLNTMKKQSSVYIKKNCFCFGYLFQRKRKLFGHMWKKVYAVMRKNVMFLYKSEFEEKALEVIILNGYDVHEVNENNGKGGFQLVPVDVFDSPEEKARPTHRFRCDSAHFEVWQKAFSFPAKQTKTDNEREKAWLKVAKTFDHSASDENLPAKNNATFPCESRKGRRRTEPLMSTLAELNRRGRNGNNYIHDYRSPYPLPYPK